MSFLFTKMNKPIEPMNPPPPPPNNITLSEEIMYEIDISDDISNDDIELICPSPIDENWNISNPK